MGNAKKNIKCGQSLDDLTYTTLKDAVTINYKAIHKGNHFATIIVWAQKVNKRCVVVWKDSKYPMQLCASDTEAREIVERRIYQTV